MEKLISKYLQNDLTKSEAIELKHWLEKDSLNRKIFENIVGKWNITDDDLSISKKRVFEKILNKNTARKTTSPKPNQILGIAIKIAAILVIALTISFISFNYFEYKDQASRQEILIEKEAANGQKLVFELPDGSTVKLNAGSKLIYPKTFSGQERNVSLIGEAFFDVAHDKAKPFRITSKLIKVKVLGTSFSVRSYPDDEKVLVAVKNGKVSVISPLTKDNIVLVPNEIVTYRFDEKTFNKSTITDDQSVFGWVDQILVFKDQEITEILATMSRWYDVNFDVKKDLENKREFTAKYKNPSLKAVLESLSYAYDFKYEIKENKVIIK